MKAATVTAREASVAEPINVKLDQGAINERILAKEAAADYRRVEQASIKQRVRLESPEGKRLFARFFHSLQLNAHFVSEICRTRLESDEVEKVEAMIRTRLEKLTATLDHAIDGGAALFAANGITTRATYDTRPLELEVGIISSFGRRFLESIHKLDQVMPLLRTLEIYEVITPSQADIQRAAFKRAVRQTAGAARNVASGLRRRMNELAKHGPSSEAIPPAATRPMQDASERDHSAEDAAQKGRDRTTSDCGVAAVAELATSPGAQALPGVSEEED